MITGRRSTVHYLRRQERERSAAVFWYARVYVVSGSHRRVHYRLNADYRSHFSGYSLRRPRHGSVCDLVLERQGRSILIGLGIRWDRLAAQELFIGTLL